MLTTLSLAVLLLHMPSVSTLAGLARTADDDAAASRLGGDVLHPALGILVLLVVTVLNVHKPRGLTLMGNATNQGIEGQHRRVAQLPPHSGGTSLLPLFMGPPAESSLRRGDRC